MKATGYFSEDFDSGGAPRPLLAGRYRIAAAICFESTFTGLIKRRVRLGPDFILTVTNDTWFGDSAAAYLHLQADIFRAVENRKWFVQCGNSGFSVVIDPSGRVVARSRLNERQLVMFAGHALQ